jgi:EAL domain-containing protein (putative c-di-GMP-specific phosphodiesterase class I)
MDWTGQSSFAAAEFPLHVLKLDQAFHPEVHKSALHGDHARPIVQLAHNLICKVVAEGIN